MYYYVGEIDALEPRDENVCWGKTSSHNVIFKAESQAFSLLSPVINHQLFFWKAVRHLNANLNREVSLI